MELRDALPDFFGGHKPRDVVIFCDPGKDDAAMLAQIYSDHNTHILGVIPSGSNATLDHTTRNTLQINELTGRTDIAVYQGANAPIGQSEQDRDSTSDPFGPNGMGNVKLPETTQIAQGKNGVEFAVETIRQAERPLTILSTGGLTDIYQTLDRLQKETPEALKNIEAVSMMAGVFSPEQANSPWDTKPYAEYNAIFDPIATKGFFEIANEAKIPVILAPLDATHTVLATQKHSEALRKVGNRVSNTIADIIDDAEPWDKERFPPDGKKTFIPIHDAMASAALLHPEIFQVKRVSVRGIAEGDEKGKTEIVPDGNNNVLVLEVPPERREKFHDEFREDMKAYGKLRDQSHNAGYSHAVMKLIKESGKDLRTR